MFIMRAMDCFSKPMMTQLMGTSYANNIGVELEGFADNEVRLSAPLKSLQSLPGVAFNGSLYSLTAMCGWAVIYKSLHEAGLSGLIWLTDSSTKHHVRITSSPIVSCKIDANQLESFIEALRRGGKASITVSGEMYQAGELALAYQGDYTARLASETKAA